MKHVQKKSFLAEIMQLLKVTKSVTMNIFGKKKILFKSFIKVELSNVSQ